MWQVNISRWGAKRTSPVVPPRLVELVPASTPRTAGRYVVRVADAEIELADDFREETLARLVRALRAC
jgi:hypothetical protein